MILIGLKGRYHSGKDTAVDYIRQAAGNRMRVERTGFADKMKLSGVRALGFDPHSIEEAVEIANIIKDKCMVTVHLPGDLRPLQILTSAVVSQYIGERAPWPMPPPAKDASITGREFWQRYGTEAHREALENNDFWVDVLLPRANSPELKVAGRRELAKRYPGVDVLCITDCRFPNEAQRIIDLGGQVWNIDADIRLGPLPDDAHVSEHPLPPEIPVTRVPNNGTLDQFAYSVQVAWDLGVVHGIE